MWLALFALQVTRSTQLLRFTLYQGPANAEVGRYELDLQQLQSNISQNFTLNATDAGPSITRDWARALVVRVTDARVGAPSFHTKVLEVLCDGQTRDEIVAPNEATCS